MTPVLQQLLTNDRFVVAMSLALLMLAGLTRPQTKIPSAIGLCVHALLPTALFALGVPLITQGMTLWHAACAVAHLLLLAVTKKKGSPP